MGGHRVLSLALAGSAVGSLALRDYRREATTDPVGAVAVVGVGITTVLAGGLALQRVAGPLGGMLGIAIGRAATTGWWRHDLRATRLRAAGDTCEGRRSHIRRRRGHARPTTGG